ncbi:MAG: LysM peptidoglycan-binding domain-containing protein [Chloroflexi bacterium]|nr:LysM peptidoglycan-binding domain-containing protein [Chloroflexota bacterium]
MSRLLILIVLALAVLTGPATVWAQGGETGNTPGSGATIHVVQRDENLFRIAMRYGTTVESISAANGITDPRYIAVGQRLLIPNAQPGAPSAETAPGAVVTHIVQPGDSLRTLLHAYSTTAVSLAAANHLTNPARLYVGQEIVINQGAVEAAPIRTLYTVRPGDNLLSLAARYGLRLNQLLSANDLKLPTPLFAGQKLWIPAPDPAPALVDLPYPVTGCTLSPVPAVQGQTVSLHLTTDGPSMLAGTFMNAPLQIATQDGNHHYALIGLHAFTMSGIYPLELAVTQPDGTQTALTLRLMVLDGGYSAETIAIEQQDLLNPTVTEPEWQRIATIMSGFSAQRYFDGLMGLPSAGAITSQFGTRRTYNEGALETFHSGTDFGGGPGTAIIAPARGVIVLAEFLPVRGFTTIIDHGWGVYTGYWHQSEILVAVGDVVTPGQTIGTIGSTGRVTGPHLHWELWVAGVQVDPMQWVRQSFP